MKERLNDEMVLMTISFALAMAMMMGCMWLVRKDMEFTRERYGYHE